MWHVVAWGLLEPDIILGTGLPVGFLEKANAVKGDILIDDLRESTWGCLTSEYRPWFPDKRGLTLDLANLWFVNRSVAELCLMARTPLFGFWEIEDRYLHPVVRAFNKSLPL
jgi:hypothetical protein